jgi:hypothetical protein
LENKKVVVGDFKDKEEAFKIYEESVKRFNKPFASSHKITNYYKPV